MRSIFSSIFSFVLFSFLCVAGYASNKPTPATPADTTTTATDTTKPADPFAFGDFTWLNGNDRQHTALLDSKYFTGEFLLDMNYTASNQHPIDHTVVGSTTLARDNEFEVNLLAA